MPSHWAYIHQVPLLLHEVVWAAKFFFFLEKTLGTIFRGNNMERILGTKFWEEKFGEQILLDKNLGSKIGGGIKNGKQILWKQILLREKYGSKFWRRKFFWEQICITSTFCILSELLSMQ